MRLVNHEGVLFIVSHEAESAIETACANRNAGLGYLLHECHNRWFNYVRTEEKPGDRITSFRIGYATFTLREAVITMPMYETDSQEMYEVDVLYVTQSGSPEGFEWVNRFRP